MEKLKKRFRKVIGEGFYFKYEDRSIVKYQVGEKYLLLPTERTIINNKVITLVDLAANLHWRNPAEQSLDNIEKQKFIKELHNIFTFLNENHQIRVFNEREDLNMSWFYGYGNKDFFKVFKELVTFENETFQLSTGGLEVTSTKGLTFVIPVERLVIDKWLFFGEAIPVFHTEGIVELNKKPINSDDRLALARKIRVVMSLKDCSFDFKFPRDQENLVYGRFISTKEFLKRNTIVEDTNYVIV